MPSYRESITSRIRNRSGGDAVEIRKRNTLADFRARNAETLKHLAAAQDARDETADEIDAIAREVGELRNTLKPIIRIK